MFFDVGMSSFVGFVLALWCSVASSAISVFVDKGKMKLCATINAVFPDIIYDFWDFFGILCTRYMRLSFGDLFV